MELFALYKSGLGIETWSGQAKAKQTFQMFHIIVYMVVNTLWPLQDF